MSLISLRWPNFDYYDEEYQHWNTLPFWHCDYGDFDWLYPETYFEHNWYEYAEIEVNVRLAKVDVSSDGWDPEPWEGTGPESEQYWRYSSDNTNFHFYLDDRVQFGQVTSNTTWDADTIFVVGDIRVPSGKTLTIKKDVVVKFTGDNFYTDANGKSSSKSELIVSGKLLADTCKFTADTQGDYYDIFFAWGADEDSRIRGCTIENATYGIIVECYGSPQFRYNTINNVNVAIYLNYDYADPLIQDNKLTANTYPIQVNAGESNIYYNDLKAGTYYAMIKTNSADCDPLIMHNDFQTESSYGLYVSAGYADMGYCPGDPGDNDYTVTPTWIYEYVHNSNEYTIIKAEGNWWNTDEPDDNKFSDHVDYTPYDDEANGGGATWKRLTPQVDPDLQRGLIAYRDKNYARALTDLKAAFGKKADSQDAGFILFRALKSAHRLNRLVEHKGFMDNLLNSADPSIREVTQTWYTKMFTDQGKFDQALQFADQVGGRHELILKMMVGHDAAQMGEKSITLQVVDLLREEAPNNLDIQEGIEGILMFLNQEGDVVTPLAKTVTKEETVDFTAHPNPFNATTQLSFKLNQESHVTIHLYNVLGQKVRTLLDVLKPAGLYTVIWDGQNDFGQSVSSGIYIANMIAGDQRKTIKLILTR